MSYNAFISYPQDPDKNLAIAIQNGLRKLGAKKYLLQFRALQIFRDETDFSGHDDLKSKIERGLDTSEYLAVLASPKIAYPSTDDKKNWIEEEIIYWIKTKHTEEWGNGKTIKNLKVIICITDGEISWDAKNNDFDWEITNCLPPILKGRFTDLPLWVDFRKIKEKEKNIQDVLSLDFPDFKQKVAEVSSKIQNVTVDQLISKDIVRNRFWRTLLSFVGVLLIGLTIYAFWMKREAEDEKRIAQSRQLAATSQLQVIPESILTATTAIELDQNNETIYSLLKAFSDNQTLHRHIIKLPDAIECLGIIDVSEELYTVSNNYLIKWDWLGKKKSKLKLSDSLDFIKVIVLPSSEIFGSTSTEIWNIKRHEKIISVDNHTISVFNIDTLNNQIFVGLTNGKILSINLLTKEFKYIYSHEGMVTDIAIGKDFIISTALSKDNSVIHYSLTDNKATNLKDPPFSANAVDLSYDDSTMSVAFENGDVGIYQLPEMTELWVETLDYSVSEVKFSPNAERLAVGSASGEIVIFDTKGFSIDSWQAISGGVWEIIWNQDTLVSGGSDGWIRSWIPTQIGVLNTKFKSVDYFFWKKKELIGIDSNVVFNLSNQKKLTTISNWYSDEILDANPMGVVTKKDNKLYLYKGDSFDFRPFPEIFDRLRVMSSLISDDGSTIVSTWWPMPPYENGLTGGVSIWNINTNKVVWQDSFPEFPKSIALYKSKILAIAGRGVISTWDIKKGQLIFSNEAYPFQPIQELAFLNEKNLVVGYLMGKIEIVSTYRTDSIIFSSKIPTGSIFDLEVLADESILSVDVDGLRWFDQELNYLGLLVNTQGYKNMISDPKGCLDNSLLGIRERSGKVIAITLDMKEWIKNSKKRTKVLIEYDSLEESEK